MIRGATNAWLLVASPLLARLDVLVDNDTAPLLEPLDDSEEATANLHLQEATRAADEAWEQSVQGHHGPSVAGPTITDVEHADPTSQDDDGSQETPTASTLVPVD